LEKLISVRIWKDGTLEHTIVFEYICLNAIAASGGQLYIFRHSFGGNAFSTISTVDVPLAVRAQDVQQSWNPHLAIDAMAMIDVGDWLLFMCGIDPDICIDFDDEAESEKQAGIYVLNRVDLIEESFFHGRFSHIRGSDSGNHVVAVNDEGDIRVLSIDKGNLVCLRPFVHRFLSGHPAKSTLLLLGSHLYLNPSCDEEDRRSAVDVVDIHNGERVRSLYYSREDTFSGQPPRSFSMATNGVELFSAFSRMVLLCML